jgi:hypothetical protein
MVRCDAVLMAELEYFRPDGGAYTRCVVHPFTDSSAGKLRHITRRAADMARSWGDAA